MSSPNRVILSVVGARPNFMKLAPVGRALATRSGVRHIVVHTGQHYDRKMSDTFFAELEIPEPDENLDVGSGTHAQQTAGIIASIEPVLERYRPDTVLVYGDVNSTAAAALVAAKLGIEIGHVEAGLRSRDRTMPEEINRIVTDHLADLLFVPSRDGRENLLREGAAEKGIHFVGNVMIDSVLWALPKAKSLLAAERHGVGDGSYALVTLHRPSNVDDDERLGELLRALGDLGRRLPILFPVHPRTKGRLSKIGWLPPNGSDLRMIEPIPYLEMLSLIGSARLLITDSGGVQEETSFLGVPCLTVRPNTERPVTCTEGTNRLIEPSYEGLTEAYDLVLSEPRPSARGIERWDGRAGERIAQVLCEGVSFLD